MTVASLRSVYIWHQRVAIQHILPLPGLGRILLESDFRSFRGMSSSPVEHGNESGVKSEAINSMKL